MDPVTQQKLLEKLGGRYKLVTLIQKRLRELVSGMPPLVEGDPQDLWGTVVREILDDKVQLITGEEAKRLRKELAGREAEELPASSGKAPAPAKSEGKK